MEDGGEPAGGSTEPLWVGQAMVQSCGGREKDIISGLGVRTEKRAAQLCGQGKGDHEVTWTRFASFALDPWRATSNARASPSPDQR